MAMKTELLRLLPLLLLLLPSPLRDYLWTDEAASCRVGQGQLQVYHPIILFPGISCPNLEARLTDAYTPSVPRCGALKGKGWFPLWNNTWDVLDHDYLPCLQEQMSPVYDPILNDFRNRPGVETRVPDFGSSYGFTSKGEVDGRNLFCMSKLIQELEAVGYRDRDTLFGAPYDLRHAPPSPGQPSQVYTDYFARVKDLVQHASEKNGNKPIILVGHSFGGKAALDFVNWTPLPWRKEFIKHMVLIAPTPPTGFVQVLMNLVSGPSAILIPTVTSLDLRPMWRTFASSLVSLPSTRVFAHEPLVVTKHTNYSAYDYRDLLMALGFGTNIIKRVLHMKQKVDAPLVPTTYLNGVGIQTINQAVYRDSNFDVEPEYVYGDGDDIINLVSLLTFVEDMRRQQHRSNIHFKFIKIAHTNHSHILIQERSLKRVMAEILEANCRRDIMS
ncbi:Lecithin-cholesterol acyltransferase-like 1 [Triticum urartu]|uniref:Lecithin-cholesterol acyltransferase-like 1 n=2 Tax=Triticum urartu TaxID=4572 RepID=M7ZES6_TRIUA|nr:lecithin-cholesterol acyltransferase-like 1 [Triticum urartu]EMS58552.1 Lecithin-cholesterol acyltransferase-like 1 [Triticum urartu]